MSNNKSNIANGWSTVSYAAGGNSDFTSGPRFGSKATIADEFSAIGMTEEGQRQILKELEKLWSATLRSKWGADPRGEKWPIGILNFISSKCSFTIDW